MYKTRPLATTNSPIRRYEFGTVRGFFPRDKVLAKTVQFLSAYLRQVQAQLTFLS